MSETDDYCDQCGAPLASSRSLVTSQDGGGTRCPDCGALSPSGSHFCEACGFDLRKRHPRTRARSAWQVVVSADRDQFEQVRTPDITFPPSIDDRVIALDRPEVQIGRRSAARGIEPDVDLSAPPADPGVSHLHALLVRQGDGSYAVMDLGSTNGTTVNDQPEPIMANTPVPLTDGDRIRLGAWTTITIRSCPRRDGP